MISIQKLAACSSLFIAICVANIAATKDLEERDISITIDGLNGFAHPAACSGLECFKECEAKGAIGGACTDSGSCDCAFSGTALRVQKSRVSGAGKQHAVSDCDLATCNKACYEKGGSPGGVCSEDGHCECVIDSGLGESNYDYW
ncbi:MAG: hypothetical protein Q9219_005602 [cf. Caloplaca sp. 3 TL-2023]